MPGFTALVYAQPFYRAREQHRIGNKIIPVFIRATGELLPKRPNPNCDYFIGGLFTDVYAADIKQKIDSKDPVKSAPGTFESVGKLPDTSISMLAFGSVPVSATLHLSQLADGRGKIEPLLADNKGTAVSIAKMVPPPSNPLDVPGGCDRAWEREPIPAYITGRLLVTVSNVKLDGRLVQVGSACRTQTPLKINLTGEPPDFGGKLTPNGLEGGGTLYQQQNRGYVRPENPIPLYPNSSNLTIPRFVGCVRPSGEDISRLISAMVSGAQNTIALTLSIPTLDGTVLDPEHPNICSQIYGCALPPTHPLPPAPGN